MRAPAKKKLFFFLALSAAAALASAGARAQSPAPSPPPQPAADRRPPLSKEDAELVKELALLERLELVRNLDLFESEKPDADGPAQKPPQRQP